jgi:tRNA nucleotidyltransferase (CCA-adding enzyme)
MKRPSPAELLRGLPEGAASLVRGVLGEADSRRLRVYLVGGPVRDWLMGRPIRDVDLIVDVKEGEGGVELARAVESKAVKVAVHERFGTVSLRDKDTVVDLASLRRESYAHDGALPSVEPATLEEDLRRRDFTVNALALPLSAAARRRDTGIVDVSSGLEDLERRRLRIFHPRSFHDDPTRVLRAARLAPRLGFALTRDTRSALRDALRDGAFGRVSGERLRREMVKLFDDARLGLDPAQALRLLQDWHVLGCLEPGLGLDPAAAASLRRLGRAIAQVPWPALRWRPWVSGLALWFAPLAPALRRRALRRLAVRGEQARRIAEFPKQRDAWLRALERARGRGAVDAVLAGAHEDALHALHAEAPPTVRRRVARWAAEDRGRRIPVGGADLLEIGLGGPAVGRALRRIRAAHLDGAVRTREEALALARELSRRRGARPARRKTQPQR